MLRTKLMLFAILAAALALPSVAQAQALGVNYFDNANTGLPDGTVRITTPHLRTFGTPVTGHGTNQCALIYVLKPDQEIAACCGCELSPNALIKLSVNNDLTANTAGGIGPSGTIVIVPSLPNGTAVPPALPGCDAGHPPVGTTAFVSAWTTHVQDSGLITEDDFDFSSATDAGGAATAHALQQECFLVIQGALSGAGVCTCGSGSGTVW